MTSDHGVGRDRLTEIRIEGLRSLADVSLRVGGLTVLIGENGSGKSSLIEALEMLRRAALPGPFVEQIAKVHGDLRSMITQGRTQLRLTARVEGTPPPLEYTVALAPQSSGAIRIVEERLDAYVKPEAREPLHVIKRTATGLSVFDQAAGRPMPLAIPDHQLALSAFGLVAQPWIARMQRALESGRVHVPFDVRPLWVAGVEPGGLSMRGATVLDRAAELEPLGWNLANCYFELHQRHRDRWDEIVRDVQAGLGLDVMDVRSPSPTRGNIGLEVVFRTLPHPVPASALSEGQLAYMGFVALRHLEAENAFIAFDEPERHLHPELLVRVLYLFEELADRVPVVLSSHADALLDAIDEPAQSVVLCQLDQQRHTQLLRPESEGLAQWLARYRGIGELRSQGYEREIFRSPADRS